MRIRSRQSARMVLSQGSARAFAFGGRGLRVAIVDEEPERLLVAELYDEVARLLGDPVSVRVRAAGEVLDPSGRERDEEEDVVAYRRDRDRDDPVRRPARRLAERDKGAEERRERRQCLCRRGLGESSG